jgi:ABC-type sugar transport system ATPase subunit
LRGSFKSAADLATGSIKATPLMAIAVEGVTKSFAGVRILDNVAVSVPDGQIHALLGANGSGKSTFAKILSGVYQPDHASITIKDREIPSILSPQHAAELGIAIVHQEAPLIDNASVAECIALYRGYPTRSGLVQWRRLHREIEAMFERSGVRIDPRMLAGRLTPAERALVSLVIALDRAPSELSLLILDEVTASLPRDEAAPYLERIAALAQSGVSVLMVTHRLAEVRSKASRMTVLRDGKVAYVGNPSEKDDDAIIAMMVGSSEPGRSGASSQPRVLAGFWSDFGVAGDAARKPAEPLMEVEGLAGEQLVDVGFTLHVGEILGLAGLKEAGIGELPLVLGGAQPRRGGRISVAGRELSLTSSPSAAMAAGIVLLPGDRAHDGGVRTLSLGENIMLPAFDRYWGRNDRERSVVDRLISDFDVRPPRPQALFGTLSGGNQQKALLAKWLHLRPAVLVLDDPTSGVDPGARQTIFELLRDAASEGLGILFFSTEPEQLAAMCSRVLILKDGVIAGSLSGAELSHQAISRWCYA